MGSKNFFIDVEYRMDHLIVDIAGVPKDGTLMPKNFGFERFVRDSCLDAPWGYLAGRLTKAEVITLSVSWQKFDELADLWAKLDSHESDQVD